MDANFFYYSVYDRFIYKVCVRVFSLKNLSSETIDWMLTKFHRNVP